LPLLNFALHQGEITPWEDHFAWNDDFTTVLGLTPTGRATVAALSLNRAGLINLRRVLYAVNEHPPRPSRQ
jgi:hypothetical protein